MIRLLQEGDKVHIPARGNGVVATEGNVLCGIRLANGQHFVYNRNGESFSKGHDPKYNATLRHLYVDPFGITHKKEKLKCAT